MTASNLCKIYVSFMQTTHTHAETQHIPLICTRIIAAIRGMRKGNGDRYVAIAIISIYRHTTKNFRCGKS